MQQNLKEIKGTGIQWAWASRYFCSKLILQQQVTNRSQQVSAERLIRNRQLTLFSPSFTFTQSTNDRPTWDGCYRSEPGAALWAQQNTFIWETVVSHEPNTPSYFGNIPTSKDQFLKEHTVKTAGIWCVARAKLKQLAAHKTATHHIIDKDSRITRQTRDTALLSVFVRGINNNFGIMEEFLATQRLQRNTQG